MISAVQVITARCHNSITAVQLLNLPFSSSLWKSIFGNYLAIEFHGFWTNWNIEIPEVRFTLIYGSSRSQMLIKIGVIKNFAKFTGKHLCWDTFLIKLQALRPENLLKRDSNTGVFLRNLQNFYEHLFLQNTSIDCFWI